MHASQWPLYAAPPGSLNLQVTYNTGDGSSRNHLPIIGPVIAPILGCTGEVFPGSLNFYADEGVGLPEPVAMGPLADGFVWSFAPVIIEDSRTGIAARRGDSGDIEFIEVFACEKLVLVLGLDAGDRLQIRLLPGSFML